MAYPEKRDGKQTGWFYGERVTKDGKRFRRRFDKLADAKGYEVYVGLMGCEPPGFTDNTTAEDGGPTFAKVAQECKAAGGPKGKWKAERDPSIIQRVDYCVGVIGHIGISKVNRQTLELIVKDLEKRPSLGKGKTAKLSKSTINRYLNAASAVLHYATLSDYIDAKPRAPLQPEHGKLQGIVSFDQEDNILRTMRAAGAFADAFCVKVLVETGLRESELLGNPRRHLPALRMNQITFETEQDQTETAWITLDSDETKNNSARSVYIRPELARELLILLRAKHLPSAYQLLKRFKRAAKACGYPANLVIHSLRHTRNTRLLKDGTDIKIRMTMLGHKSVAASLRYAHVDTSDQLKAAKKLEARRGETPPEGSVVPFAAPKVLEKSKAGAG